MGSILLSTLLALPLRCAAHPIWYLNSGHDSEDSVLLAGLLTENPASESGEEDPGMPGPSGPAFKYVFLTMDSTNGALDSLPFTGTAADKADAFCNIDLNRPNPSVSYKAMVFVPGARVACTTGHCSGGGATEHLNWVLSPSTEYRRSDGTTIIGTTMTTAGIFNFNPGILDNSATGNADEYWTGMQADWTVNSSDNCSNWGSSSNFLRGVVGRGDSITDLFMASPGTVRCDFGRSLLCVEQ